MKKTLALAALLASAAFPAQADHHGRGKEQLNGFPGIYKIGPGTATFTGDGFLVIVIDSSNVAAAIFTYAIDDMVMTVKDVSPPAFFSAEAQACVTGNAATYAMTDQEHGFTLAAKDEPCAPRLGLFDKAEFVDYVRPAPKEEDE